MDNLLETQIFPESEIKGKTYIDPNSTQMFIEALVKLKENESHGYATDDLDEQITAN